MGVSVSLGISMVWPLIAGFVLFSGAALKRGFTVKKIFGFVRESLAESFIVIGILLIIGCLTGTWRLSGTVAYFITAGISSIPPRMFLLAAFLLASVMSYALGTSFGVSATAGVILMSIARAGGVDPVWAAGAVLSGVYFGDRGSPAASSANLVAVLTHTDMRRNVREMLKCSFVPYLICIAVYTVLSLFDPMDAVDTEILDMLGNEFDLHWACLVPAVLMIVLPLCKVKIKLSMIISLAASVAAAMLCQGASPADCLHAAVFGYSTADPRLDAMLSGGGVVSMIEVSLILIVSCSYGKIFQGTGMLDGVNDGLKRLSERIGRFPAMLLIGLMSAAVFCNQTIGAIMQSNLSEGLYRKDENYEKMIDMENSVILLAGMVPWCIACSVPLAMLGADIRSIPFSIYLWLVPLWWLLRGRKGHRVKR